MFNTVIGRTWLAGQLYGNKYAAHFGKFPQPLVYLKAVLFVAAADSVDPEERLAVRGLLDLFSPDVDTEVHHFVDCYPVTGPPECNIQTVAPQKFGGRGMGTRVDDPSKGQVLTPPTQSSAERETMPLGRNVSAGETVTLVERTDPYVSRIFQSSALLAGQRVLSRHFTYSLLVDCIRCAAYDRCYSDKESYHCRRVATHLGVSAHHLEDLESCIVEEMELVNAKRTLLRDGVAKSTVGKNVLSEPAAA